MTALRSPRPDGSTPDPPRELEQLLSGGRLDAAFQPVVDLDTMTVVGYEALARGPTGSPVEQPLGMFARPKARG